MCGLVITFTKSLSSYGYAPSGTTELCMPRFFKYTLNVFPIPESNSWLLQTFPCISEAWDSRNQILLWKTKVLRISAFAINPVTSLLSRSTLGPHFQEFSFHFTCRSPSCRPYYIRLQVGFGFPNSSQHAWIDSLYSLWPYFHVPYASSHVWVLWGAPC